MTTTLSAAYTRTVKANQRLEAGTDDALVQAGRTVAKQIDQVLADKTATSYERTKALYLIPHLMNVLKEQEATPASRTAAAKVAAKAKAEAAPEPDMLDKLDEVSERRQRRRKHA